MTQEFLQDAIVEDLKQLFSHYTLTNSLGVERAVKIVPQGLPIREGDDEETDAEAPPEPYVAVKLSDGEVTAQDARQTVNVVMVICVCDPIRWATQEEDTHPYYFAAVGLPFYAPAIFKEVPET